MRKKELAIINMLGLHARAAAKFVTLASTFESHIQVGRGDRMVNGKSIMGVLMLAAAQDSIITLIIEGDDEIEALQALEGLINDRFEEAE